MAGCILAVPVTPAVGAQHFICSAANSAKVPCRFATPSGNIRCVWTPVPESVACELRSSARAYRLAPSGHARKIAFAPAHRGVTLPLNQQLVFPRSLSCHDTKVTMSCNQDFGLGSFTLGPRHSHAS